MKYILKLIIEMEAVDDVQAKQFAQKLILTDRNDPPEAVKSLEYKLEQFGNSENILKR